MLKRTWSLFRGPDVSLAQFKGIVLTNMYARSMQREAAKKSNEDATTAVLIDVRRHEELKRRGRVPTAVHVPLHELQEVLLEAREPPHHHQQAVRNDARKDEQLEMHHDFSPESLDAVLSAIGRPGERQLVFFCEHGMRSQAALDIAETVGYSHSTHLPDGYAGYAQTPVTRFDVEKFIKEKSGGK